MASLRRSRNAPTEDPMAKFLYTILKQLDLKSIDWQEVANGNHITNGHAARMRYSRFKAQMEGLQATTRKPRATVPRQKKARSDKPPVAEKESTENQEPAIKGEPGAEPDNEMGPMQGVEPTVTPESVVQYQPLIKSESVDEENVVQAATGTADAEGSEQTSSQLVGVQDISDRDSGVEEARRASSELRVPKKEPVVKSEPVWEA